VNQSSRASASILFLMVSRFFFVRLREFCSYSLSVAASGLTGVVSKIYTGRIVVIVIVIVIGF
jgi:hypothetical protein